MSKLLKVLIALLVVVSIVCGIIYFSADNKTDETNNSKKEADENIKSIIPKNLSIKDEKVTIENGQLNFEATIHNTQDKKVKIKNVIVTIRDEKKKTISQLNIAVNNTLGYAQSMQISSQEMVNYDGKYKDIVYRFEVE